MFSYKMKKKHKKTKKPQVLIYLNGLVIAKILEDKKDTQGKERIF